MGCWGVVRWMASLVYLGVSLVTTTQPPPGQPYYGECVDPKACDGKTNRCPNCQLRAADLAGFNRGAEWMRDRYTEHKWVEIDRYAAEPGYLPRLPIPDTEGDEDE